MATRDNLIKVRRVIAEFKIYINRTQTYLAPLQLFMIFLIFLNTTVWNVDWIQSFFGSKTTFIGAGVIVFIVGVLLLGYIDTLLKLFRVEQGSYNSPDRNPFAAFYPVWTALMIEQIKNNEIREDAEKKLKRSMKEIGIYDEYISLRKKWMANEDTK